MSALETRVPSYTSETLRLVEDASEPEHPAGVSALVSRLNCSSSVSDAGSQGSPETEGCSTEEQRQEKNWPWLNNFSRQCRCAIGSKSMKQLDDLLSLYIEHVTPHYRDCHKLPNKAAKLKRNINDTMIFFHMLYMDIREPLENAFYYDKMTELTAMYLDLEITAARRGKDTEKTVTNKLSTSLYTFLDHSEDHILDALLKTKLINKHSKKVSVPLLRKVLSELVVRRPLAELTYVRFLLSFKLWKNVVADAEERRAINKLALQRLHPPPEYFLDHEIARCHTEVLPRIPKSKKNCTLFYLGAKFSVKDACRAFFRYCKDTCRSNVYKRNISGPDEIEKPFLLTTRATGDIYDIEEGGSCNLINDIWSAISNGESSVTSFGESDMFCHDHLSEKEEVPAKKKKIQPDSPDSRVEALDKNRRKELKRKKETSVPDPKFVMIKTEGASDALATSSPAKGVQDCCLGSVFMMEQVNKVGGAQSHVKVDPSETELPTSSRQHSVLESLGYVQSGSDNEAVASSSVSPDAGSVPPSHLDTNECDSSVEILQSRQVPADVSLPLELKPPLNMDGKVSKEDLLLFSGSDPAADEGAVYDSFSEFGMFRLNDDIFNCRSFEGMDQSSMMYRRTDVAGSLPFQGSPLLEEDEDEFSKFRWSSVPDFTSVQSTIINQSSGTGTGSSSDLSSCYSGMESKSLPDGGEEPKLGQDLKPGKGATSGTFMQTVVVGGKVMRVRSDVLARYRAAYFSHMRARSVTQTVPNTSSEPHPQSMSQSHSSVETLLNTQPPSTSHSSSNNLLLEGSDNLKILAEEAVRVREASVAEAKCKSEIAANLNLPLKKRKSLSSVGNTPARVVNCEQSYPSAPMLSIAQVQGLNKSVIVMNSQYSWSSGQAPVQGKNNSLLTGSMTGDANDVKPIDMSSSKKPSVFSVDVGAAASLPANYDVQCKICKKLKCQGKCHIIRKTVTPSQCCNIENCVGECRSMKKTCVIPQTSIKCARCQKTGCNGKCSRVWGVTEVPQHFDKGKVQERSLKTTNGILKVRSTPGSSEFKCSACLTSSCDGSCKPSPDGTKVQKVTFQDFPTKSVLKSMGCNGKFIPSNPRCSSATSSSRKSQRCVLCKIPSCNGLCKSSGLKCTVCFSGSCEGTCYLTGRSTNNSLSTVNDFSILNSSAFVDKPLKCNVCKNTCCGKCKNASGFKYCPYCTTDMCNGSNINHSIRSILAAGSKSKADAAVNTHKRKAPASNRRTRSSSSASKQYSSNSTDTQDLSSEDVKRRKKSLPKSMTR